MKWMQLTGLVVLLSACGVAPPEDTSARDGGDAPAPVPLDSSAPDAGTPDASTPDASAPLTPEPDVAKPFARGMVSITLDDSLNTQYTAGLPALNARGIHATWYVITEAVRNGWDGYMTVPQLREVQAGGHELGAHTMTHRDLTTLTADELDTELRGSQEWLKTEFSLPGVPSLAAPFGAYNTNVLRTAQKYYANHRTVNGGENLQNTNILQLRSYDIHTGVSVDTVRGWIDAAAADGAWLVLTFHQLTPGAPSKSTEYGAAEFVQILDLLPSRAVDIVTVAEGVARMEGKKGETSGDATVYADALGDGFTNWSWAPVNLDERTRVHGGRSAISAELGNYKALFLRHSWGLPAEQYSALSLWVNGGATGGQGIRLAFCEGSKVYGSVRLDSVLGHPLVADTWEQVIVPLSSVGLATGTVKDLYLQDDTGKPQGTVYFDDLRLLRAGALPPTPPSTTFTLYADSLDSQFTDWSWAPHDLAVSTPVHSGSAALSFEPDDFGGVYFHTKKGVDLSLYKTLSFWVHGGTTGHQNVRVVLKDDAQPLGEMRFNAALGHEVTPGLWQHVLIPLGALGASTGTLHAVLFQDQSGKDQGSVYLDDIQLLP